MINYFNIEKKRSISAANFNYYPYPTDHPDRIMTEHDFIYMVEGTWKIGQGDEEFELKKGDVLILYANMPHYGIEPCSPHARTMYIHAEYIDSTAKTSKTIEDSLICTKSNPMVKECFEKIIYAKNSGNDDMASCYFDALICELEYCQKETSTLSLAENIHKLILTCKGIPKNTEIAKELNTGLKTCENAFKEAFGLSIHQYIIASKIEQAKYYLENHPQMKLSEIAETLGFYDEFHLSRHFKKITSTSPGKYKNKKQK